MNKNKSYEFKYKSGYAYFSTRLLPVPIAMFLVMFILILGGLPRDLGFDIITAIGVLFMIFGIWVYFNSYPEIVVQEDSFILSFAFRTYNISFSDVIGFVELERWSSHLLRVDLKKLSTVNSLVGIVFGSGGKPAFLVNNNISGYRELVGILEQRTGLQLKKQLYWF